MRTRCCNSKRIYKYDDKRFICANQECKNYLSQTRIKLGNFWIFSLVVFMYFFVYSVNSMSPGKEYTGKIRFSETIPELNKENLKEEIEKQKILCPDEVYAQILLESSHLKSFLSKEANNLLGMRYPFQRETKAIGLYLVDEKRVITGDAKSLKKYAKKNNYAVYNNWTDCIGDYKIWQEKYFNVSSKYLIFLGKVYAEDEKYISKIKSIQSN